MTNPTEVVDGRDLSRVRTQLRLTELALLGLLATLPDKDDRTHGTPALRDLATALETARGMSWRAQQALDTALEALRARQEGGQR